jgi:hypothetical protein
VRLMQQQQRDEGDLHGMMTCIHNLGVLLRDAGMCLAPWREPWRFRPVRDAGRLQLLRAAQVRGKKLVCLGVNRNSCALVKG